MGNQNLPIDAISQEEAKRIREDSERAIEESVRGFDKESLRRAFTKGNPRLVRLDEAAANYDGRPPVNHPKPVQYICRFDNAKGPFWLKYKERIMRGNDSAKVYLTENNKDVLENIIRWMLAGEEGEYDQNKGLFIYGDYGRGKTDLITTMVQFSYIANRSFDNVIKLPRVQYYKFMVQKAKENNSVKGLYKTDGVSVIDDLGFMQQTEIKIYGNSTNTLDEIVEARYRTWKSDRSNVSIFTSNLSPEFIHDYHGEGILSRLVEMCNIILWDGPNFRL